MRVLLTGHRGYIGSVLAPMLKEAGHDVWGCDSGLFEGGDFGSTPETLPSVGFDVRDVERDELAGFDAVIHLAGISNDPLGDLDPGCTDAINHLASTRLAKVAKAAGVGRFLFASSCSLYGAAGELGMIDEGAPFNPVTPYGRSKVDVEADVLPLADDDFSPSFLRCATAYGVSPRLRADLVVNNLVGYAVTEGRVLLKSDGSPWRPLVHVEDIARAYLAVLQAPREQVHAQAFNVGVSTENYRMHEVATIVQEVVEGSVLEQAEDAGSDPRCYRVDCSKLEASLPEYRPRWTVRRGVEQLYEAYVEQGLTAETFLGPRYLRLREIQRLQQAGQLDALMRWTDAELARSA